MKDRVLLLTGATGIMGSWVLGEALRRQFRPTVVLRDSSYEQARQRLGAVLRHVGRHADLGRVRIVLGDTCRPRLGLSEREAHKLRETLGGVVHCAACTSFSPDEDQACWDTNVGGVDNLLEFLGGTDVPFYHVSTAYVAGKRRGFALESELDVGQEFNNAYEWSKCEAEKRVQRAFDEGRVTGSIFRPSIIVGATEDGRIAQFMNFYNVLRMVDLLLRRRVNGKTTLRVAAAVEATKNLVPIDWTVQALWHIIEKQRPSQEVYHLTNPRPMTHGQIQAWANDLLGSRRIHVDLIEDLNGNASPLEALIAARLINYRPYMFNEPLFDRTNTDRALDGALPFPEVTPAFFSFLMAFARREQWRGLFEQRNSAEKELSQVRGEILPAPAASAS